jgi:uncharacterized protein (DUF433 family)
MPDELRFTAAEAAFLLREPVKSVKKALDEGPVQPVLLRKAGQAVRAIDWSDLFYLFAMRTLRDELTPKARAEFYQALKEAPVDRTREVRFGRLKVEVADLFDEVEKRTRELSELAEEVEFRSDGEAVLKGTNIEVHRIAALLDGEMSVDDVLADYPSLSRDQVMTAKAYADSHPRPGRPFPRTTLKRAMQGIGLEALDEVLGGDHDVSE